MPRLRIPAAGIRANPGALFATIALLACAPVARGQDSVSNAQGDLPPAGFGTLNQGDIALTLQTSELEIRVVPLDERVIRLLAPDAYSSLHGLVLSRSLEIDSMARRNGISIPGLFFVTYFGRQPGARFDSQNLTVVIRNQLYRPVGIVPYSANFNSQQLDIRQQASGIYLFEQLTPVFEPFTVSYGSASSDWEGKLSRIQRERSRVMSRVRADTDTTVH